MAEWCVVTRQSPEVFYSLNTRERKAFVQAVKKMNKPRK